MRDLYASYMDQAARDARGIAPIKPMLERIAKIDGKAALVEAFGHADVNGTNAAIGVGVDIDRKNPDAYLVSIGVAGIPSASLVAILLILKSSGIPGAETAVIALLAVDRLLDMSRTAVNVFSDSCAAVVIAKSEGEQLAV